MTIDIKEFRWRVKGSVLNIVRHFHIAAVMKLRQINPHRYHELYKNTRDFYQRHCRISKRSTEVTLFKVAHYKEKKI